MDELQFMDVVRTALSDVQDRRGPAVMVPETPENFQATLDRFKNRPRSGQLALLEPLSACAAGLNINLSVVETVKEAGESILNLVREKSPEYGTEKKVAAWRHPLIDRLDIVSGLAEADIPLVLPPEGDLASEFRAAYREEVAGAFVGITAADYCVAETATLTMKNISGHPRIVSLLPVIHVGVVTLDQLVENRSELYFRLQWDPEEAAAGIGNGMTFISGPSKTGDIELVMVHGAHGPRELHLYVVTGDAE